MGTRQNDSLLSRPTRSTPPMIPPLKAILTVLLIHLPFWVLALYLYLTK